MALCRNARFRIAASRWNSSPLIWPGQLARHVQHSALGTLRCKDRQALRAAHAPGRKTGAHLHLQQPALGSCCARIRLRLLARLSKNALPVGSAVRRFRQWCADHHRSIHRFSRIEVAKAQRNSASTAARLRRPRTGTFQRAAGALFASMRRG